MGRDLETRRMGKKPAKGKKSAPQNHVLISGCKDNKTSADAYINKTYQGAFTWALTSAIKANPNLTWSQAHKQVLATLKGRYTQIPQLSGNANLLNRPLFGGTK